MQKLHKINPILQKLLKSLFKVKIYVMTSLTLYKLTSRDYMEKEKVSLTLYKIRKFGIHVAKQN